MQDLDELKHVLLICVEFEVKKTSVSSFYKEDSFKRCLTKQLLNMFKLWFERGIRQTYFVLNIQLNSIKEPWIYHHLNTAYLHGRIHSTRNKTKYVSFF